MSFEKGLQSYLFLDGFSNGFVEIHTENDEKVQFN